MIPTKQVISSTSGLCQSENPCAESKKNNEKFSNGGNFIEALTNTTYFCRQSTVCDLKQVYKYHFAERSAFSMSMNSLEICTESLGNETGSDIVLSVDEFSSLLLERQSSRRIKQPKRKEFCKKIKEVSNFPPPLSSISSGDGVAVEAHREGGRLVMNAFSFPSCRSYFKAERENGRLRLSLATKECGESEHQLGEDEVEVEVEKECEESNFNECLWGEKLEEDGGKVGCKIGVGDWSSNKRMPSLPFCVAIS